ncbi:MAG: hypothetical protein DMG70_05390 [Acidobacteria bacterium]|nr:MAG: hypothetical protein DMG70_05390 [Acidobacteriota bacterium]
MRARLASPTLLGTLSALLMTSPTVAGGYICWIDRVVTEGTAVRILFSRGGFNITGGAKSQGRFVIGNTDILWLSGPKDGQTEPGLLLMNNESAILFGGVHDTCIITFAEVDGHIGVTAHSSFSVPPERPSEKTVFIPSE